MKFTRVGRSSNCSATESTPFFSGASIITYAVLIMKAPIALSPLQYPFKEPETLKVTVDSLELMLQRYTGTLLLVSPWLQ